MGLHRRGYFVSPSIAGFMMVAAFLFGTVCMSPTQAHASSAEGTLSGYAWSENAGWIDFSTSGGAVHVNDSALTGYAYAENIGWISLNCSNTSSCVDNSYAVANNAEGTLSGFAWSENAGWLDFAPAHGGVIINSSGVFTGYAYSENLGWIVFATDHPVTTDWRPASSRTTVPTPTPVTSGGGGMIVGSGPTAPSAQGMPGYKPPRQQIVYPDGRVVYTDGFAKLTTGTALASLPSRNVTPPSTTSFSFTTNHQLHDTSRDVKALQQFLNTHGFIIAKNGAGSPGQETTTFGTLTREALKKFQASVNLPATGYFGPLTRTYITNHY